ncbi:DUF7018 domain-containing (lipo)protein [Bacillus pseudomycoides]|uniref:DUF7018 domain-containing (lipo)protein n=1 Tax=Bacillus pseudomycoides TaxID=64104 RepID=UPI001FB4A8F7|nr:hypothetical protein [Bacillus pseudomycoides]
MKAKRLVSLAIPLMLLGGCSSDKVILESESSPKQERKITMENKSVEPKEKEAKAEEPKPVDVGDYSTEEYINSLTDLALELQGKVDEMDSLVDGDSLSATNKYKYRALAETSKKLTKQARELKVPKEFAEVHKDIDKAMQTFESSFQLLIESITESNPSKAEKAVKVMEEAGNLWVEASKKLGDANSKVTK